VVEADVSDAGTYRMHYLYETQGLGWTANHTAIYDQPSRKIESYQVVVNLQNQSGTTFPKANLWLLSGSVEQYRGRSFRVQAAAYAPGARGESAAFDAATVQSVGERKVYRIPGTITLVDNQSRQIPLVAGKDVPVEHEYYVPAGAGNYGAANAPASVSVRLKLKNCAEHNLGTPLPAGSVKVYERNNESKLQLTADTETGEVALNEPFNLEIGTSSDVKAERVLSKSKLVPGSGVTPNGVQPPEYQDRTYTVKVYNFKKSDAVDVLVEAAVPIDQDDNDIKPLVRKHAGLASAKLHVDAGKNNTLSYTLRIRTR